MTTVADVDLGNIATRLSALPEAYVLAWFWMMVRQGAPRMAMLQILTTVRVWRPKEWDRAAVRREHEEWVLHDCNVDHRHCFMCDNTGRLYFHHVVEIQHGGSNHGQNKVPLCFRCHQILHPWLTEEPEPQRSSGWTSIASMAKRLLVAISVVKVS
jgi:hypothetical protein